MKVLLVDADPRVREGLRVQLQLEPGVRLVGEAETAPQAITMARSLCPDVVIIDLDTAGMDGIQLTGEFNRLIPCSSVMLLSIYDDPARRREALDAGAHSYVGKGSVELFRAAFSEIVRSRYIKDRDAEPPHGD